MPLDISDAQDTFLYGRAEYNKWADEFMSRWMMPMLALELSMMIKQGGLEAFLRNPELVLRAQKLVNAVTGR